MSQHTLDQNMKNVATRLGFFEIIALLTGNWSVWCNQELNLEKILAAHKTDLGKNNSKVEATLLISILMNRDMDLEECMKALDKIPLSEINDSMYRALLIKAVYLANHSRLQFIPDQPTQHIKDLDFVVRKSATGISKTFLEVVADLYSSSS